MSFFTNKKRIVRRIFTVLLWLVGVVLSLACLSIAALFLLCKYQPQVVNEFVQKQLHQTTDLYWQLEDVQPEIFPLGISSSNIAVYKTPDFSAETIPVFFAKELVIQPDVLSILTGKSGLLYLAIDTPIYIVMHTDPALLQATLDENARANATVAPDASSGSADAHFVTANQISSTGPASNPTVKPTKNTKVSASSQNASKNAFQVSNSTTLTLESDEGEQPSNVATVILLEQQLQLTREEMADLAEKVQESELVKEIYEEVKPYLARKMRRRFAQLSIKNGQFTEIDYDGRIVCSATDVNMELSTLPWHDSSISGVFSVPAIGLELSPKISFQLPIRLSPSRLEAELELDASLTLVGERPITGAASLAINWVRDDDTIVVQIKELSAEENKVKGELVFNPDTVTVAGEIEFSDFSLPRWFYFARSLPPGLQEALDDISGKAEVFATSKSIHATNVQASASGLSVKGSLGVDSFSDPVLKVDLELPYADVDYLFPFLAVGASREVKEPTFTMPYLAPFPGDGGENTPDLLYDILVRAEKVKIHGLDAGPLAVTVFPVGETKTRVGLDCKNLAQGSLTGHIDVDKTLVEMLFNLNKLNIRHLPENDSGSVIFAGTATGKVALTVPVVETEWADDWDIQFDGDILDQSITVAGKDTWTLSAKKAIISGDGSVHTVSANGLRLKGVWDVATQQVYSSWFPKGEDAVNYTLKGTFGWPAKKAKKTKKDGIEKITGDLVAEGTIHLPIGDHVLPVSGTMRSPLVWNIHDDIMELSRLEFSGMGSTAFGSLRIDSSGTEGIASGSQKYTLAPQTILRAWNMLPSAVQVPAKVSGRANFRATGEVVAFSDLTFTADTAPMTGAVTIKRGNSSQNESPNMLVVVKLNVENIDLDKYLPPPTEAEKKRPPSKHPWDLSPWKGIDIQADLLIEKAFYRKINMLKNQVEVKLAQKKLTLKALSTNVYGGTATWQIQGTLDADKSTLRADRGALILKSINLRGAFADFGKVSEYGGMADMAFEASGTMRSPADFPGALSGRWSVEVRDGLYPAFLGHDTAGLRNVFTKAKASGLLTKGVMFFSNFLLNGGMVEMHGGGSLDLGGQIVDINLTATLAGMPSLPVHFFGSLDSPTLQIGSSSVIIDTARIAGSSIFNLFLGVLELPLWTVEQVGDLFTTEKKIEKRTYAPTPAK